MAQSHQESALGRDKDYASGSSTVGPRSECHRGLPGAAEVVQRSAIGVGRRRGRDAGVHQVKERAEKRESSPAGCDHRLAGLEQGAAICDERMDSPK